MLSDQNENAPLEDYQLVLSQVAAGERCECWDDPAAIALYGLDPDLHTAAECECPCHEEVLDAR